VGLGRLLFLKRRHARRGFDEAGLEDPSTILKEEENPWH
jgi:hypothetical protein